MRSEMDIRLTAIGLLEEKLKSVEDDQAPLEAVLALLGDGGWGDREVGLLVQTLMTAFDRLARSEPEEAWRVLGMLLKRVLATAQFRRGRRNGPAGR